MKTFRILYYIPDKDGHYIDDAIGIWTKLGNLSAPKELYCSHKEIWLPDENGEFCHRDKNYIPSKTTNSYEFAGTCTSSTMGQVGGKNRTGSGVRVASASSILTNAERWYYGEFVITEERYNIIKVLLQDEVLYNKGYDKAMILNFFIPIGIGDDEKWVCMELVNYIEIIALRGKQCDKYEKIVEKLNTKMSPIRSAYAEYKCGVKFYRLIDDSLLI